VMPGGSRATIASSASSSMQPLAATPKMRSLCGILALRNRRFMSATHGPSSAAPATENALPLRAANHRGSSGTRTAGTVYSRPIRSSIVKRVGCR